VSLLPGLHLSSLQQQGLPRFLILAAIDVVVMHPSMSIEQIVQAFILVNTESYAEVQK
jgi:hypothetical protein